MAGTPLDIDLLKLFVGGAVGVAVLTATIVLFIQRGFSNIQKTLTQQRKEIDKILNDHGLRIMRAELKLFGWSMEGPVENDANETLSQ